MRNESICLFSSYFCATELPFFVRFYLEMLRPHFTRIIFITNNDRKIDESSMLWLSGFVDDVIFVKNEGYDFGMWQKAIQYVGDLSECKRLGLINDSCICFAPLDDFFDWVNKEKLLAAGMVKSYEKKEHIQSFFVVLSGAAIQVAIKHVVEMKIEHMAYDAVVDEGELGLSAALLEAGICLSGKFGSMRNSFENPSFVNYLELFDGGIPLIKRKLLSYPPGLNPLFLIWHTESMRREYFIRKIMKRHIVPRDKLLKMFSNMPPRNFKKEILLYVRLLRGIACRLWVR